MSQSDCPRRSLTLVLSWRDFGLTWKLYTTIIENADLKKGLFPSPGGNASTKDGGGKSKAEFHAMLAAEVFGAEDSPFKAQFYRAKTKAEKEVWTRRIKNRLHK